MFDGTTLNMDDPTTTTSNNKLLLTSDNISNVTNLGENSGSEKTGLFAFNNTVKDSIEYVYLNNNSFGDVDALTDFKKIIELQLRCNSNLSDIDGLENHSKMEWITLHNCDLDSIGNYDESSKKYSSGLTGCTKIKKISLQSNSELSSLVGLEDATDLVCVVANNCDLSDIKSLANHSNVRYLDLASNTNLVSVKYIQYCKALNYIFLDNNTDMSSSELDIALNGTDASIGNTVLIKNCINGYSNIPSSYWDLFLDTATVLDYSVANIGETLTVNSAKWVKLKGRTDVTKLKLDGQTNLLMDDKVIDGVTYYGINSTLKSMNGMVALSLKGCSQVTSVDFAEPKYETIDNVQTLSSGMPNLYEIDLRSVSASLINLSPLNNCLSLNRLLVNNSSIDASLIVSLINRFKREATTRDKTWYELSSWELSGYVAENDNFPNFSGCSGITSFEGANYLYDSNSNGILDLRGTSITKYNYIKTGPHNFYTPTTCNKGTVDNGSGNGNYNFSTLDGVSFEFNHGSNSTLSKLDNFNFTNSYFYFSMCYGTMTIPLNFVSKTKTLHFWTSSGAKIDFVNCSSGGVLERLEIGSCFEILNLNNLGNLTNLKRLSLCNCGLKGDINWISNLANVEYLNISNNAITDISGLAYLKKINMYYYDSNNVLKQNEFPLQNNNISDLTPLVTAIGDDGIINYRILNLRNNSLDGYTVADNVLALLKLHKAGLNKIYLEGNNFSVNEINELINGKEIENPDGSKTFYQGFGTGNITY